MADNENQEQEVTEFTPTVPYISLPFKVVRQLLDEAGILAAQPQTMALTVGVNQIINTYLDFHQKPEPTTDETDEKEREENND